MPETQTQTQAKFKPGLLQNVTPGQTTTEPGTPVVGFEAATYTPEKFETKPEQTVQHQLEGIIDADSPLMQQAKRRSRQQMNARGLLNSSMAVGAGQEAVIAQALPIASQDASTYQRNLENTLNARHAQLAQRAQAENVSMGQAAQGILQRELTELGEAGALARTQLTTDVQRELGQLDARTREQLAQIQADTTLTVAEKDIKSREAIAAAENASRELLQRLSEAGALERTQLQTGVQRELGHLDAATRESVAQLQADTTLTAVERETQSRQLIAAAENANRELLQRLSDAAALTRTELDAATREAIAQIDADIKREISQLDADNRQLLQTNASAAQMFQEVTKNIAAIATDNGMTKAAKDAATTSQLNLLNQGLQQLAEVARTDQAALGELDLSQYFIEAEEEGEETEGGGGTGTTGGTTTTPGGTPAVPENFTNKEEQDLERGVAFLNSPANYYFKGIRGVEHMTRALGISAKVAKEAMRQVGRDPDFVPATFPEGMNPFETGGVF